MPSGGYIHLYRSIRDSESWISASNDTTRRLMIELLLSATWRPNKVKYGNGTITLKPGQLLGSVRGIAEMMECTERVARGAIDHLIATGFIVRDTQKGTQRPVISICNWGGYQVAVNGGDTQDDTLTQGDTQDDTLATRNLSADTNAIAPAPTTAATRKTTRSRHATETEKRCEVATSLAVEGVAKTLQEVKEVKEKKKTSRTKSTPSALPTEVDLFGKTTTKRAKQPKPIPPEIEAIWQHYLKVRRDNGIPARKPTTLPLAEQQDTVKKPKVKLIQRALRDHPAEVVELAISKCFQRGSHWHNGYRDILYALRIKRDNGEDMVLTHTDQSQGNGFQPHIVRGSPGALAPRTDTKTNFLPDHYPED